MTQLIATNDIRVVIGTGVSGRSVARYLLSVDRPFVWLDTRETPPNIESLRAEFPTVEFELGGLNLQTLMSASEIIVSPGVSLATEEIAQAKKAGVPVLGDIDLFLREASAPVVAITGSNAKSTVTSLLGAMAEKAGVVVAVGGNIGVPVLELLQLQNVELYVLELSSFQLETVEQLNATAATVLNVSEDHMDRYDSLAHYHMAKQRVYFGAKTIVTNRQDPLTVPPLAEGVKQLSFGLNAPDRHGFGVITKAGQEWLAYEFKALMPCADIKMPGRHNVANALAALALGHAVGLSMPAMLETLKKFPGLEHRCQWIADKNGVSFFNDSKGTNVGATLAALQGLSGEAGKTVLIAGGVGKGADFKPLKAIENELRRVVLIGEDADKIEAVFADTCSTVKAGSMDEAVKMAVAAAQSGDRVLLSPACASFDMFDGFEDRGNAFVAAVREQVL